MIYAQLFEVLSDYTDAQRDGKTKVSIKFFLDDFATNVYVDGMPRIISTARARNISIMLICQSVQQLKMMYGEDSNTILSNVDNLVYMGSNDLETAREFSTRLDKPVKDILCQGRDG